MGTATKDELEKPDQEFPVQEGGGGRSVVTLSPAATAAIKRMGAAMGGGLSAAEVVRRGLMLLDLKLSLVESEELVIRNKETGEVDRIRFTWDAF